MKHLFTFSFLFLTLSNLKATHNRAGEILYKRIAPFTNVVGSQTVEVYTYSITVIKYTDDGQAIADRCVDTVYFGDGTSGVAPRINGQANCGCGTLNSIAVTCGEIIVNLPSYRVKYNVYSIIHTYPGQGSYLIRSSDPNRNSGIHNIPNSVNIPFYIEARMNIVTNMGPNSSPVLSNPPTDQGTLGNCLYINSCAYDADGDSISYELTTCRGSDGNTAPLYFDPETGSSGIFTMNAVTGLLTWCTPQFVDQYNIAFLVKEWRRMGCNGTYKLLGYVMRDMQVITKNSTMSPTFSSSTVADTCITAGTLFTKNMAVSANGMLTGVYGETGSFGTAPAAITPTYVNGSVTATYSWQTQCSQARKKPYEVDIVYNSIVQKFIMQFKVTVLPPAPVCQLVVDTGVATLTWNSLSCLPNLAGYNIYRKTGTNSWTPGPCEQGVPASSGFVPLGTVPAGANNYTDMIYWPIMNGTAASYIVTAYTSDCAESMVQTIQTTTLLVGIGENQLEETIRIYPNPFQNQLELNLGHSFEKLEAVIYAGDGKQVYTRLFEHVNGRLDLSLDRLLPGMYVLSVKTESGVFYKKLIRE